MKRTAMLLFLTGLIVLTWFATGPAESRAGMPPALQVNLGFDKTSYLSGEPISATLTVTNQGPEFLAAEGFMASDFTSVLNFIDPDHQVIIVIQPDGQPEPLAPAMLPIDGTYYYVDRLERVPGGWSTTITFNPREMYALSKSGMYTVYALVPIRTYSGVDSTVGTFEYAKQELVSFAGNIKSNTVEFAIVADADGDQYSWPVTDARLSPYSDPDCDDHDPAVHPGVAEVVGDSKDNDCNPATADAAALGTINVQADLHTVGPGSHPASSKAPLSALPVRVYDKSQGSCAARNGVSWQNYQSIWQSCYPTTYGMGTTDRAGALVLGVAAGNYIVIGEYRPGNGLDPIYLGVNVGGLTPGGVAQKYLQVILNANGKNVPAKYTVKTGSQLLIIEPEYIEWDGAQELYPFVFESVGDWSVATSVSPPAGFVADYPALSEEVNSELAAVQFTITDIGSDWVDTGVVYDLTHKGKKEKVRSQIGVKLSKNLAKKKGLDQFGHEKNK